jgi:hypothetical protein
LSSSSPTSHNLSHPFTDDGVFEPWTQDESQPGEVIDSAIDPRLFEPREGFEDVPFGISSQLPLSSPRQTGCSPVETGFKLQLGEDPDYEDYNDKDNSSLALTRSQPRGQFSFNGLTGSLRGFDLPFPLFSEFSPRPNRRALVDHFCSVLSHLIVFKEELGNPFQKLVLPLCQKSDAVMNALCALTSAHLEYRGVAPRHGGSVEKSVYFHNQSIQGLSLLIQQGSKAKNELLAAIMLLIYYEVVSHLERNDKKVGSYSSSLFKRAGQIWWMSTSGVP